VGPGPQDNNGYLLQRYMLHTDLHFGPNFRFFGQLKSGLENGRTGGPRPADEDKLLSHEKGRVILKPCLHISYPPYFFLACCHESASKVMVRKKHCCPNHLNTSR